MTFQRKLFLGFCLMTVPVALIGAEALRSNREERLALEALGGSMARSRTFAELETAMFSQSEAIWQALSGLKPRPRDDFETIEAAIAYWQRRWEAGLAPDEMELAGRIDEIHGRMRSVGERVFRMLEEGRREEAYQLAQRELAGQILPELTRTNREIYGATRERSVRRTYARLEEVLAGERRALFLIVAFSLLVGVAVSMLISRSLARPLQALQLAMADAGRGRWDRSVDLRSRDEVGDLARAFAAMSDSLRRSHEALAGLNADLEAKIEQLERAQAQLIQSEKLASIGEMSAAVAHGLRNPLASLRAAAQLALHRMRETPSARAPLQDIVTEVDRLDRRIGHLLSFSKPAPFRPRPERLSQIVAELLPSFAPRFAESRVRVETDVPEDLPDVRVDPIQLEQALVEVLSNALDAMPEGGRLSIRGQHEARDGGAGLVRLEIADSGGGIPESVLPSVCEPFFTTRAEGTGLGLAIARRYVAQNGGELRIESRPATGTTVRLEFPATEAAPTSAGSPAAGGAGAGGTASAGSPARA
ncbi:MAG: sensor histidine kinase [Gemmatimonadota bacterium]